MCVVSARNLWTFWHPLIIQSDDCVWVGDCCNCAETATTMRLALAIQDADPRAHSRRQVAQLKTATNDHLHTRSAGPKTLQQRLSMLPILILSHHHETE